MLKGIDLRIKCTILALFIALVINGQEVTLSGRIFDEGNNEPLIGATISIGEIGTISDLDGNYSISLPTGPVDLLVSYIGFETKTLSIDLKANQIRDISLKESTNLLQTATITSGKFEKALGEITVSMEVLKPKLIENTNTSKISEVLEKVPGVNVIDGQPNIRGGSGYSYGAGSRVLLLIDDIPALQSDSGFPNWDDIPFELTNQIEILKGASSALYGSSAMNGIINLRTDFAKLEPETKVASAYTYYADPANKDAKWWGENGSDTIPHSFISYISHKQKFGKLDFVGSLFFKNQNSWNRATYIKYIRGNVNLKYRLSDRLSVGVNTNVKDGYNQDFFYWQNETDLSLQGAAGTFSNSDNTRFIIDPYLTYFDKNKNKHKLISRIYRVRNDVSNNRANKSILYYGEYQFQKKFENNFTITSGIAGNVNKTEAQLFSNATISSNNIAAYLQLDKKFGDKLNASLGGRYERNQIEAPDSILVNSVLEKAGTDTESKPVFRVGLNYKLFEFTYLRASLGQAYRFPTIAEKYISTNVGFNISPNVDLFSETGWSAELGVKQGFKVGEFNGLLDLAVFRTSYNDMMEFTFTGVIALGFQSQNIGNTDINGVDFNVSGTGKIGSLPLNLLAGYTYIDPKFKDFGELEMLSSSSEENVLKYRFEHTAKIDLSTDYPKFNIGLSSFYYSHMKAIDKLFNAFLPGIANYREENNKGFTIFEARASYLIKEKFKISLLAKNLSNKTYTLRPALINAPFNVAFRIDYTF